MNEYIFIISFIKAREKVGTFSLPWIMKAEHLPMRHEGLPIILHSYEYVFSFALPCLKSKYHCLFYFSQTDCNIRIFELSLRQL